MAPFLDKYQRILPFLVALPFTLSGQDDTDVAVSLNTATSSPAAVYETLSHLPTVFRKNEGQWSQDILFQSFGNGADVRFLKNGVSFGFRREEEKEDDDDAHEFLGKKYTPHSEEYELLVWNVYFGGMNASCTVTGDDPAESHVNYFRPGKNVLDVTDYSTVQYHDVYPQVDLRYYCKNSSIEYDFVVQPGGDPAAIRMGCSGIKGLRIDKEGQLRIHTRFGKMTEEAPKAYQLINGKMKPVAVIFILVNDTTFGFSVNGKYDRDFPLVIDPVMLEWSTYAGGVGNGYLFDITLDAAGNVYGTGFYNAGMPTTPGSYDPTYNTPGSCGFAGGDEDAYVFKMAANASNFIWCTYIGGTCRDRGRGIALDPSGNVYVTGWTESINFPTVNPWQSANAGNIDAFAAKLDPNGTSLLYSTYFGGNYNDWAEKVAVNSAGEAYLCGAVLDLGSAPGFPTTAGAFQPGYGGGSYMADGYVVKLNAAGNAPVYSTYLGGNGWDWAYSIAINANGEAFVTGKCEAGFPTTAGAFQTTYGGSQDVFVTRLDASGSALTYSTYLGGNGGDQGYSIAINSADEAFVTGNIHSPNFPVTAGCYDNTYNGGTYGDAFVSRLNAAGTALIASSYVGTPDLDIGWGIAIDANNNMFIAGYTESAVFPTTPCPVDATFNSPGSADYVIFKMNPAASSLMYSTYFGGNGQDYWEPKLRLYGSSCDQRVVFCGTSHSTNLPTTPGVMQPVKLNGVDDQPSILRLQPKINPGFTMSATTACTGVPIQFNDTTTGCGLWDTLTIHQWDFGDGNQASGIAVSHAYNLPGTYTVMLIVGCPMDTAIQTIVVTSGGTFSFAPPPGQCLDGNNFSFNLTGTFPAGTTFAWNFGPNATPATSSVQNPPGIIFSSAGAQNVSVTVTYAGCGASTSTQTVMVYPPPVAAAIASLTTASLDNAAIQFTNSSAGIISSAWDFGDGYQSTSTNPSHTYSATGTYTTSLIVTDPNGCVDTTTITIVIDEEYGFYIPNGFSPNGDGLNETFGGTGTGITDYHLRIFDRWGMLLYETDNYSKPWDGTFKGKKVEEDVYVYTIDVTNLQHVSNHYIGHVSVVK